MFVGWNIEELCLKEKGFGLKGWKIEKAKVIGIRLWTALKALPSIEKCILCIVNL